MGFFSPCPCSQTKVDGSDWVALNFLLVLSDLLATCLEGLALLPGSNQSLDMELGRKTEETVEISACLCSTGHKPLTRIIWVGITLTPSMSLQWQGIDEVLVFPSSHWWDDLGFFSWFFLHRYRAHEVGVNSGYAGSLAR